MRNKISRSAFLAYGYISLVTIMIFIIVYETQTVPKKILNKFVTVLNKSNENPVKKIQKLNYFKNKNLEIEVDVSSLPLFYKEDNFSDRVVNQLIYQPPDYENYMKNLTINDYKKIFLLDGISAIYGTELGESNFKNCAVSTCSVTLSHSEADLVIYKDGGILEKLHPDQILMVYTLESPLNFPIKGNFDWTSTYRRDSDIVAPYGQWEYYNKKITQLPQNTNFAAGKSKKVAWFVSNCDASNQRLEFAKNLSIFIQTDIYGKCGDQNLKCPRDKEAECSKMLQTDYKFYLAFENSNCRDYVTEKVFYNALQNNVVPIVMGGFPEDYRKILPEKSFIHVNDFSSVESLAAYLNLLDKDDVQYNSYFKWKGTGEFIDTQYWCRVCAMLHVPERDPRKYSLSDVSFMNWWLGDGVCETFGERLSIDYGG